MHSLLRHVCNCLVSSVCDVNTRYLYTQWYLRLFILFFTPFSAPRKHRGANAKLSVSSWLEYQCTTTGTAASALYHTHWHLVFALYITHHTPRLPGRRSFSTDKKNFVLKDYIEGVVKNGWCLMLVHLLILLWSLRRGIKCFMQPLLLKHHHQLTVISIFTFSKQWIV